MNMDIFFWEKMTDIDLITCQQGVDVIFNNKQLSRKNNPNKSKKIGS